MLHGVVTQSKGDDRSLLELQVLEQIRDSLATLNTDMRDTRERVIRLEERDQRVTAIETSLATLDARVDVLLKDKDRRDGAITLGSWFAKHWPGIIGFVGTVIVVLQATGKI